MATHRDFWPTADSRQPTARRAFTLVEMLVAMAITLVMMAAVVTLFANVSHSVRNRRATIEMSGQLRHLRNVLQQDLQGATCPGVTWQRPESNHGYIELIEGQYKEGYASNLIDGVMPPTPVNPEIDHRLSIIPSSNLPFTDVSGQENWITDAAGLGDYDDILMLTVRNEHEPFIGRMPRNVRPNNGKAVGFENWEYTSVESTLAEVVWYAIENPGYPDDPNDASDGTADPTAGRFFGEPGMRTIYRRTLLIAPWLNPYRYTAPNGDIVDTFSLNGESDRFQARPGLLRVLPDNVDLEDLDEALAALVAFQERYDLSVRLQFDPNLDTSDDPPGRYIIVANTLADLTKRENRYEHYSFRPGQGTTPPPRRDFPYAVISMGRGYETALGPSILCVRDPEDTGSDDIEGEPIVQDTPDLDGVVVAYKLPPAPTGNQYRWRPFAYINTDEFEMSATTRVMLNDLPRGAIKEGEVIRIVHGLVPLSGERRGEDVMMTGALGFDVRVYDPGAPLFATRQTPGDPSSPLDVVLTPSDPGWRGLPPLGAGGAYMHVDNMKPNGTGKIGTSGTTFPYVGQGAYVDMGYGYDARFDEPLLPIPDNNYHPGNFGSSGPAWFFKPRGLSDVFDNLLAPGYAIYDTWSFHYENNGVNDDADEVEIVSGVATWQIDDNDGVGTPSIDEGTNGLDDWGHYTDGTHRRLGVDDVGERETVPPYDRPLRGMQVLVRTYEPDSRAIRQIRVNQHFMQE
jgi:prepilin-type N-terminal cleavage/methylation domain-containing protein